MFHSLPFTRRFLPALVITALVLVAAPGHAATEVLLSVDFTGMTPGNPVGTGGPSSHEPNGVSPACTALIDGAHLDAPCLAISDNDDYATGSVTFTFLDGAEITSGILTISMDLAFSSLENYIIYVREPAGAQWEFLSLIFQQSGLIRYKDEDTLGLATLGSYEAGTTYALVVSYDMDAGTYDLTWNGVPLLTGETHGVTERGVGTFYIGTTNDANLEGTMYVDNILVTHETSVPAEARSWSNLKRLYR